MSPSLALRTAGLLLLVLGIARAAGGVVLASGGGTVVDSSRVNESTARLLGVGLIVVGLISAIASFGCMQRRRWGWNLGLIAPILFVADGLLNGTLLFGRPGDMGTIVNVIAATMIVVCLGLGKRALRDSAARKSTT